MQRDAVGGGHALHALELQADDLADLLLGERGEHDDLVDAVEELRTDGLLQQVEHLGLRLGHDALTVVVGQLLETVADERRTHVARHNDDRVFEVHRAALVVRQAAVVEHLQQHVEDVRMRLLDLVEEDDRVGFASDGLRELSALVVTDVSRRRPDESRGAELLLILAHVDPRHHVLVVEEVFGERLGQLRLADARSAEEDERSDGSLRVLQPRPTATHSVCNGADGLVLTYDAPMQLVLQMQQFLALALQHLAHRDARPAGDDVRDVLAVHLLFDHGRGALHLVQLTLDVGVLFFFRLDPPVANLGYLAVVALALGAVGLVLQRLDVNAVLLDAVDQLLLALPAGLLLLLVLLEVSDLAAELLQLRLIVFALDGLTLDLELGDAARHLVERLGYGIHLHAQAGRRLVHQVDGFVG